MNAEASTKMEPVAVEPITRVGTPEQLSAAREARGWSRSDIAAKLGMMPRQIEAIEQGRWEALPGHAFVRGAIRAYGKTLQVDVAPLLAALGAQAGVPELRASSSLDSPLPRHGALGFDNGGSGSRIVWILLGIAGVVAIAMYFGRGADFGGVLEPGTPSGRAVDAVPLVPGSISGDGGSPAQPGAGAPASATAPGAASDAARTSGSADAGGAAPVQGSSAAATRGVAVPSGEQGTNGIRASSGPPAGDARSPGAAAAANSMEDGGARQAPPSSGSAPADDGSAAPSSGAASYGTRVSADGSADDASAGSPARSGASGVDATTGASAQGAAGAASAAAATATPQDALVLRFEQESWVEVRDGTGRVLLLGTQPANSMREVVGPKPYSMTIGNATFVRVEHRGRDIDLGAVTQRGVARVRVE